VLSLYSLPQVAGQNATKIADFPVPGTQTLDVKALGVDQKNHILYAFVIDRPSYFFYVIDVKEGTLLSAIQTSIFWSVNSIFVDESHDVVYVVGLSGQGGGLTLGVFPALKPENTKEILQNVSQFQVTFDEENQLFYFTGSAFEGAPQHISTFNLKTNSLTTKRGDFPALSSFIFFDQLAGKIVSFDGGSGLTFVDPISTGYTRKTANLGPVWATFTFDPVSNKFFLAGLNNGLELGIIDLSTPNYGTSRVPLPNINSFYVLIAI